MPEAAPVETPPIYPPEHHFLRDLATDVQIHYLAQAKQGAARTTADLLRTSRTHTLVAVTVHESTDPARVLCRATVGLQPAPLTLRGRGG